MSCSVLVRPAYFFLCAVGALLSCYAHYVESSMERDQGYEPLCDVSPHISCSEVLTSKYSRGMGVVGPLLGEEHPLNFSNAVYGIFLYAGLTVLGFFQSLSVLLLLGQSVVVLAGVYLMYLLYVVLEDFCVLCTTIHVINILIWALILSMCWQQRSTVNSSRHTAKKRQ